MTVNNNVLYLGILKVCLRRFEVNITPLFYEQQMDRAPWQFLVKKAYVLLTKEYRILQKLLFHKLLFEAAVVKDYIEFCNFHRAALTQATESFLRALESHVEHINQPGVWEQILESAACGDEKRRPPPFSKKFAREITSMETAFSGIKEHFQRFSPPVTGLDTVKWNKKWKVKP